MDPTPAPTSARALIRLYQAALPRLEGEVRLEALGFLVEFLAAGAVDTDPVRDLATGWVFMGLTPDLPADLAAIVKVERIPALPSTRPVRLALGRCVDPHALISQCRSRVGGFDPGTDPARLAEVRDAARKALVQYAGLMMMAHMASPRPATGGASREPKQLSLLPWALRRLGYPIPPSLIPQELAEMSPAPLQMPRGATAHVASAKVPAPPRSPGGIAAWLSRLVELESGR